MKNFELRYENTRLYFGIDAIRKMERHLKDIKNVMIATGRNSARLSGALDDVETILSKHDIDYELFDEIKPNPNTDMADKLTDVIRKNGCDCLIAIGGGSVIDVAKVSSVMVLSGGNARDYLMGRDIRGSIPLFVVNLTHGTGSEIDRYAVLTDGKNKVGISIRYPDVSFDDPRYLLTLPREQSIYTSLDAFFHAYEAVTSRSTNPLVETLSFEAARIIGNHLPGDHGLENKYHLLYASMISGISLDMSPAHVVHAIEHALSGTNPDLPHGCGLAVIGGRSIYWIDKYSKNSRKLLEVLMSKKIGSPDDAEKAFREFLDEVGFDKRLSDYGFGMDDFKDIERMIFGELKYFLRRVEFDFNRDMLRDILKNSL